MTQLVLVLVLVPFLVVLVHLARTTTEDIKLAQHFAKSKQFEPATEDDVLIARYLSGDKDAFDRYLNVVRQKCPVVKKGHLVWIWMVIDGRIPSDADPPALNRTKWVSFSA